MADDDGQQHVSIAIREDSCAEQCSLVSSPSSMAECRICQEEDDQSNLESPCACSGTLKYAHHKCVQRWCDEKGDTICEICHEPYKCGYHSPPPPPPILQLQPGTVAIDFSDDWGLPGSRSMELRDPRILALAAAQRRFLESEYDEYSPIHSGSSTCCRSLVLILLALLLLRHTITMMDSTADDDASMFIVIFLLRVVGFFLPCYIVARAMNMLEARRQEFQAGLLLHTRPDILTLVPAVGQTQ